MFYFGDFTEGTDTITDFLVGGSGDVLKFGGSFAGSYTRDATVVSDSGANGTTDTNMATNSGVLPKFLTLPTFATANTTTGVKNQLTNFKVTTDGSMQFQTVLTLL